MHKTAYVTHMIEGRPSFNRFILVDRPPSIPTIAPNEYVFYEVASELSRQVKREWDAQVMRNKLFDICSTIGTEGRFYSIFLHSGHPSV